MTAGHPSLVRESTLSGNTGQSGNSGQSRTGSAVEACVHVIVGYWLAIGAQYVVFPMVGIEPMPHATHHAIAMAFTGISWVRTFALRRVFNWLGRRGSGKAHSTAIAVELGRGRRGP